MLGFPVGKIGVRYRLKPQAFLALFSSNGVLFFNTP